MPLTYHRFKFNTGQFAGEEGYQEVRDGTEQRLVKVDGSTFVFDDVAPVYSFEFTATNVTPPFPPPAE